MSPSDTSDKLLKHRRNDPPVTNQHEMKLKLTYASSNHEDLEHFQ